MRKSFAFYIWVVVLLMSIGIFICSKDLSKVVIRGAMKVGMLKQISQLEKTASIEEIIIQLRQISKKKGVSFTVLKNTGEIVDYSGPIVIPDMVKVIKKHKGYGIDGERFYTARAFELRGEKFIICNGIDKNIVQELIKVFQFVFNAFSIGTLGVFSFIQIMGLKFFSRKQYKVRSIARQLINNGSQHTINQLNALAKDDTVQALIHLHKNNEELILRNKTLYEEKTAIIECLDEGVIVLDSIGRIKNINLKATQLLKIMSLDFIGKYLQELIRNNPSELGAFCLDLMHIAKEQDNIIKDSYEAKESEGKFFEIIAQPIKSQNGFILILQDHSSDYKVLSMGKNFVTNASHELRTPITIIKGFTETLKDLPEISEDMLIDITDKILRNCHRMASVVKSLLVLADLDYSGKASMQPCDLVGLIESCSYTLLSAFPDVKVETLFNEKEPIIWGDPDLLELAIMNLFENAVKYSDAAAYITVTVESLKDHINLSIKDRGIGIAQKDLNHIFERFYTVNKSHSRKLGGAGLGLSIVKTIIEKHNAKIHVESPGREGSIFTIQFPKQ
ncbi:MAG: hypothetical protein HY860_04120 [Chlamydiales bacterium]|nr:hypothetical protein [Chlamydiales bacterium]